MTHFACNPYTVLLVQDTHPKKKKAIVPSALWLFSTTHDLSGGGGASCTHAAAKNTIYHNLRHDQLLKNGLKGEAIRNTIH